LVKFGVFLPSFAASAPLDPALIRRVAVRAEELGFAHLWVGDHFVWNVGMLAPLQVLSYVASVTTEIRLGTGVYLLPLRHPSITAKDVSSLDVLSGGRVILGIGAGGDSELEYQALGVDLAGRGAQVDELLEQVGSLLRQEGRELPGQFHQLPAFTMAPPPIQQRIPIWVGGRAAAVVDRAAQMGDGWFPVWVSQKRYAEAVERITEVRDDLEGYSFALNIFSTVAASREDASAILETHMGNAYALPFDKFARYSAYGTEDDVAETLRSFIDVGVTDVALNLAGPDPLGQLEALASVTAALA
jgi:probable F420-dependent oxidoreductase